MKSPRQRVLFEESEADEWRESDVYSVVGIELLLENDETSPNEAAFMEGYDEDSDS